MVWASVQVGIRNVEDVLLVLVAPDRLPHGGITHVFVGAAGAFVEVGTVGASGVAGVDSKGRGSIALHVGGGGAVLRDPVQDPVTWHVTGNCGVGLFAKRIEIAVVEFLGNSLFEGVVGGDYIGGQGDFHGFVNQT